MFNAYAIPHWSRDPINIIEQSGEKSQIIKEISVQFFFL